MTRNIHVFNTRQVQSLLSKWTLNENVLLGMQDGPDLNVNVGEEEGKI